MFGFCRGFGFQLGASLPQHFSLLLRYFASFGAPWPLTFVATATFLEALFSKMAEEAPQEPQRFNFGPVRWPLRRCSARPDAPAPPGRLDYELSPMTIIP